MSLKVNDIRISRINKHIIIVPKQWQAVLVYEQKNGTCHISLYSRAAAAAQSSYLPTALSANRKYVFVKYLTPPQKQTIGLVSA